ncbi:GNAT family N-acetyltransferase [Alkalibacter mobilis]|uniref:GNAT family N-acetyltransferase n=1 Tax=Alkalibacter mobilis TaxID=2787712 RepID=UPI00189D1294|nr:GNAT family N-acetyltransferase [Alkalibacter mobilis]MBF7096668.1 N-acetyltransferase [Alkalibacter mobilis]
MIREAVLKDLKDILRIFNYNIKNTTAVYHYDERSPEEMRHWFDLKIQQGFPVIVEEMEGEVVGFATFGTYRPFRGFDKTVEHSIYVDAEYRGRGIGKKLLFALMDLAKEKRFHIMVAYIDSENAVSLKIHENAGFFYCGKIKEAGYKFEKFLDLVIMQYFLE